MEGPTSSARKESGRRRDMSGKKLSIEQLRHAIDRLDSYIVRQWEDGRPGWAVCSAMDKSSELYTELYKARKGERDGKS